MCSGHNFKWPPQLKMFWSIYIYISQRPFVSHNFTCSLVFFVLLLSLLRQASSSCLVFFDDPQSSLMLLSLLRQSSSSSSSSFPFFFRSSERHVVVPTSNCRVSSTQQQAPLYRAGPGLTGPGRRQLTNHQVTPFILLKSICVEGLMRRHETECRHVTSLSAR